MLNQSHMNIKNIKAAVVLMAVTAGYAYQTSHLPERTLPNTPDPSFFPWINTVFALVLTCALLYQGLFIKNNNNNPLVKNRKNGLALLALAVFLVFIITLPYLGFILAAIPFVAVFMWFYGEHRKIVLIIGALGIPVILYVLFRHGFGVMLPRGLLAGLIA
jgi:Tripartite tricarboxylate transporter TctB family.